MNLQWLKGLGALGVRLAKMVAVVLLIAIFNFMLVRAAPGRIMRQGLPVKAQHLGPGEAGQKLGMGGFHHFGGGGNGGIARPLAQGRADDRPFVRRVGAIGRRAETLDRDAIGADHRGIDAVQRGAGHRPQRPEWPFLPHLPLAPLRSYTAATS